MGKLRDNKKKRQLVKTIDRIPENKIDYVQEILNSIISLIEQETDVKRSKKKSKYDFSDLIGSIKLPKNFDAVAYQRKLRDEWN